MSDPKTILERAIGPFEPREQGLERTRRRLQHRRRTRRLLAGGVALLLFLLAFSGLWTAFHEGTTPADRPNQRVPSAQRGWIAYTVGAGVSARIFVTRVGGTGTHSLVGGRDPAWSPDGSRIAFRVGTEQQTRSRTQIDVANADGTGVKTLASLDGEPGSVGGPTWSPDGRHIAYATFSGIYVTKADGGQVRRLVRYAGQSACYDLEPAWSPEGSTIAFAIRCDGGEGGIWVVNTDGSGLRKLIGPAGPLSTVQSWSYPVWSPDGTEIAFHHVARTERGGGGYMDEVSVMSASGDHVSVVVPNVDYGSSATWSPDGLRLAFVRQGVVYLVNLDGRGLQRLSPEIGIVVTGSPAWQVDTGSSWTLHSNGNLPATVILDPPVDQRQFDPPNVGDKAELTAEEALAAFEVVNREFNPPGDIDSYLGRYTAAIGDGTYRFEHRLAYGFTWHECMGFANRKWDPKATPAPCTFWLFLDANTGVMLEAGSQLGT